MIELFTAKSGAPSVKVDGVALHSPYDPAREARRFIQEALGDEPPSVVIVLGECLGHIAGAVRETHPRARVLTATYSVDIARAAGTTGEGWNPSHPQGLEEFLRLHLGELEIEGLRMVEWPPAARAFPAASRAANEAVRRVVQELNGSLVTTVAAGRTWLRNCFSNFLYIDHVVSLAPGGEWRPIVIAAPGPSLEQAAEAVAQARDRVALWALPSSCPFLRERGLEPDLVVMTDPGFYALHHLQFAPPPCPIGMPLSAARGVWSLRSHPAVFLLKQPFLPERALLEAADLAGPEISPHGTVTATAIELALASTRGPVVVAGLDLGARDLVSHARPNAFDVLLHLQSGRLRPHTAQWFTRNADLGSVPGPGGGGFRSTSALRTYAGWLDTGLQHARGRLFRLLPSPIDISGMTGLDGGALVRLAGSLPADGPAPSHRAAGGYPGAMERRSIAHRILTDWLRQVAGARDRLLQGGVDLGLHPLVKDLVYLVSPRRLVDALRRNRQGETSAAADAAVEALGDCSAFLGRLAEKLSA